MNIGIFEIALKEFVEVTTSDLMFLEQGKKVPARRPIRVFSGFLPPNTAEDEIPAIAIRFNKAEDSIDARVLYFDFYFAIFNRDSEGYKELTLLIERVINNITEKKYIGEYLSYSGAGEFEIEDEQPYPFWIGSARLKFEAPKPDYIPSYY
ncbi:hypothetical protein SAMN02745174_02283 [Cetobacterium ceti]|uniref:Uncharacterized protein n=1 Tax=Cetobacterium ceti TaxID=180163 RepID=A0A1T4QDH9_9FUSO|nr:hypothetical protein [Cetobacterium ceti]SKA01686.1 hypothetical protein SAMN02745174_02283 [Cetobacterium ceti]